MTTEQMGRPPRWVFALILMGASAACGIFLGKIHAAGFSAGDIICAAGFGLLALPMLWGTLGAPNSQTE